RIIMLSEEHRRRHDSPLPTIGPRTPRTLPTRPTAHRATVPARLAGRSGPLLRQTDVPLPERPTAPFLVSGGQPLRPAGAAVCPPRPVRDGPPVAGQRPTHLPAA